MMVLKKGERYIIYHLLVKRLRFIIGYGKLVEK